MAHIILKTKQVFPTGSILLELCPLHLLFLIKIIALIIKAIISTKSAIMKYQNKIILGAFSIINISSIFHSSNSNKHLLSDTTEA